MKKKFINSGKYKTRKWLKKIEKIKTSHLNAKFMEDWIKRIKKMSEEELEVLMPSKIEYHEFTPVNIDLTIWNSPETERIPIEVGPRRMINWMFDGYGKYFHLCGYVVDSKIAVNYFIRRIMPRKTMEASLEYLTYRVKFAESAIVKSIKESEIMEGHKIFLMALLFHATEKGFRGMYPFLKDNDFKMGFVERTINNYKI